MKYTSRSVIRSPVGLTGTRIYMFFYPSRWLQLWTNISNINKSTDSGTQATTNKNMHTCNRGWTPRMIIYRYMHSCLGWASMTYMYIIHLWCTLDMFLFGWTFASHVPLCIADVTSMGLAYVYICFTVCTCLFCRTEQRLKRG